MTPKTSGTICIILDEEIEVSIWSYNTEPKWTRVVPPQHSACLENKNRESAHLTLTGAFFTEEKADGALSCLWLPHVQPAGGLLVLPKLPMVTLAKGSWKADSRTCKGFPPLFNHSSFFGGELSSLTLSLAPLNFPARWGWPEMYRPLRCRPSRCTSDSLKGRDSET